MRILSWLLRAFIFFTLFAFALNNQHTASVHWFFGVVWRPPMVFVVLAAFAAGCALGAAALLPGWLKGRQTSRATTAAAGPAGAAGVGKVDNRAFAPSTTGALANTASRPGSPAAAAPSDFGTDHPSRLGV